MNATRYAARMSGRQTNTDAGTEDPATKGRPDLFEGLDALEPLAAPPWFEPECAELGVAFDQGDIDRLGRFLAMLLGANERVNLTAIKDPEDAWRKHIFDALTLIPLIAAIDAERPEQQRAAPLQVADVGSGAGLPAIPLAICLREVGLVAVESTAKKARFIEFACRVLGLTNCSTAPIRAEEAGRSQVHRDTYDIVTARAVGPLATIAELGVPLARIGGVLLFVKGARADEELAEAKAALHALHATHETTHPTPTGRVVVLSKARPTPHAYPRKPGEPKRAPIGR